jgi:phosphatidylinositol 3-kinase
MKITDAMLDAMGGTNSTHYAEFRHLCYTTFLHLRRHANLVLNLFALMTQSSMCALRVRAHLAVQALRTSRSSRIRR